MAYEKEVEALLSQMTLEEKSRRHCLFQPMIWI